jgi:hypothetical protein
VQDIRKILIIFYFSQRMVLLGIVGSPRRKGSAYMVRRVLEASQKDYEILFLKDLKINYCCGDADCRSSKKCLIEDDMQVVYSKMIDSEGIVLGTPTYFNNVSGLTKNFMDRCLPLYFSQRLKGKKIVLLNLANLEELLEFDAQGNCIWHKEETDSALECSNALLSYAKHLELNVIGRVFALHEDPKSIDSELIRIGKLF